VVADERTPRENDGVRPAFGFCVDPGILGVGARNSLLGLRRNGTCRLGDPFFATVFILDLGPLASLLELFPFPFGPRSKRVDWRRGEGDLRKTGDLTPIPALMGEALEALMLLAEGPGGGTMNETSVRPAESSDAPCEANWPCSTTARSSSTSIASDTAKVELAPAARREGDDGADKVTDGLGLLEI